MFSLTFERKKVGNHTFLFSSPIEEITTITIPGWATDYRIFPVSADQKGTVFVDRIVSKTFVEDLLAFVDMFSLKDIHLVGFSLGGFLAIDILKQSPSSIQKLTLVGIREFYPEHDVILMEEALMKQKETLLKGFYRASFSGSNDAYTSFKSTLMDTYLALFSVQELREGLQLLRSFKLHKEDFTLVPTRVIHGRDDKVAPLESIQTLVPNLEIYDGMGHVSVLTFL